MNGKAFDKRTFTFSSFTGHTAKIIKEMIRSKDSLRIAGLSPAFQEKIMLAVTAVNGCIMCSWYHCKKALEAGCTDKEIQELFDTETMNVKKDEALALTFAQHYAETRGNPSKEAFKRLIEYYGVQKSKAILVYILMITVGNLSGNTIEAFEYRLKKGGRSIKGILFEFFMYLLGAPIFYYVKWNKEKQKII